MPVEKSKDEPLLIRRIRTALAGLSLVKGKLRVSVADEPKWEKSHLGDEVLVRWLCWSIDDGDKEVVAPEFEVLSKDITSDRLRNELPQFFPDLDILVDNDIEA